MLRQTLLRTTRSSALYRQQVVVSRNYGIVDAATKAVFGEKGLKEKKLKEGELENEAESANLTAGRKLANGIQDAQDAAHDAKVDTRDFAKDADSIASKANLKTGKVLADGIEDAENVTEGAKDVTKNATEKVKNAADDINKTTGRVLADGIQTAQDTVGDTDNIIDKTKETVAAGAEKVNKKVGDVLADGIQAGQNIVDGVTADKVNKKTGKVLADGVEKGEELANKALEAGQQAANKAKETLGGAKQEEDILKEKASQATQSFSRKNEEGSNGDPALAKESSQEFLETKAEGKQKVRENVQGQGYSSLQQKGRDAHTEQNRPDDGVY